MRRDKFEKTKRELKKERTFEYTFDDETDLLKWRLQIKKFREEKSNRGEWTNILECIVIAVAEAKRSISAGYLRGWMDEQSFFYSHVLPVMLGVVLLPRDVVGGGRSRERPRPKAATSQFRSGRRGNHGAECVRSALPKDPRRHKHAPAVRWRRPWRAADESGAQQRRR